MFVGRTEHHSDGQEANYDGKPTEAQIMVGLAHSQSISESIEPATEIDRSWSLQDGGVSQISNSAHM